MKTKPCRVCGKTSVAARLCHEHFYEATRKSLSGESVVVSRPSRSVLNLRIILCALLAAPQPLLAWRVEINYMSAVVFAATHPKAKWAAVHAYWEAYGDHNGWPSVSAVRAPEFDGHWIAKEPWRARGRAFSEEYLR